LLLAGLEYFLLMAMGKRILCVDDDLTWCVIIETALQEAGYSVQTAENATDAMHQADGFRPDLVILDLDLDGENSLQLMQFIRENFPATKVILYTGTDETEEAISKALKKGAFSYLRKGVMSELLAEVEKALA
jgi:DNA-binding NtrC family response regulator